MDDFNLTLIKQACCTRVILIFEGAIFSLWNHPFYCSFVDLFSKLFLFSREKPKKITILAIWSKMVICGGFS